MNHIQHEDNQLRVGV